VHESDFDLDRRTIGLWEYPFVRTYHPRYHGESVSIRGDTTEIAAWLRDSSTKAGHMSQLAINTFETRVMDRYRVKAGAAAFVYLFVGAFIVWLVAGLISSYI
jgi:hypothetical protein